MDLIQTAAMPLEAASRLIQGNMSATGPLRSSLFCCGSNGGRSTLETKVAERLEFVQYVTDQVDNSCNLTHRMMFGGCTLYLDVKVVALICDDQLFVKPTRAGREFIGNVVEAPAYPGAKNSFLIEDQIEDGNWLAELLMVTAAELPAPRPKKKK